MRGAIGDGCITTYTGRTFPVFDPRPEDVDLRDVAHALSQLCRWGAHCRDFYSVASHCCEVAFILQAAGEPERVQLAGLLHDAGEAYLVDVPRPIKRRLLEYGPAEDRILAAVFGRFGVGDLLPLPAAVKIADERACVTEARDLMHESEALPWATPEIKALPYTVRSEAPRDAERRFLAEAHRLLRARGSAP